ncbi:Hypothetical predicted protein [Pelobates cultripes]|uniref:Uncharacterized protein n=1 Tax=Pelobates cultripes TaxID=61616 RepID=A0AAD1T1F7_PELCU|nr:Hypothetical predicted protein [Pelobates cultripes]
MADTLASHTAANHMKQTLQGIDKLFARFWAMLERRVQPTQRPRQRETQKGLIPKLEGYQMDTKPTQQTTKPRTSPCKPRATGALTQQRPPRGRKESHCKQQTCNRTLHRLRGKQDLDLMGHKAWSPKSPALEPTRSQREGECCPNRILTLEKPNSCSKSIPDMGIG